MIAPPLVRARAVVELAVRKAEKCNARIEALTDELFAVADARDRWATLADMGASAYSKIRAMAPRLAEEADRVDGLEETPGERAFMDADAEWQENRQLDAQMARGEKQTAGTAAGVERESARGHTAG